jgi:hypothetical protein
MLTLGDFGGLALSIVGLTGPGGNIHVTVLLSWRNQIHFLEP